MEGLEWLVGAATAILFGFAALFGLYRKFAGKGRDDGPKP